MFDGCSEEFWRVWYKFVYYPSLATSYAVYGRPYFLYQMYSFSCKHTVTIISDTAISQYCTPYILQQLCNETRLSMKVLWTNILIAGGDNLFKRLRSEDLKDGYGATSEDKTPTFRSFLCGVSCESRRSGFLQKATVVWTWFTCLGSAATWHLQSQCPVSSMTSLPVWKLCKG